MEYVRKTVRAGSRTDLNFGVPMNRKRPSGWKYCSAFRDTNSQLFDWGGEEQEKASGPEVLQFSPPQICESSHSLKSLEVWCAHEQTTAFGLKVLFSLCNWRHKTHSCLLGGGKSFRARIPLYLTNLCPPLGRKLEGFVCIPDR
jgi:hypothetical protein